MSPYLDVHETATKHDDVMGGLEVDGVKTAGKHDVFEQTPVSPEKPTSQLQLTSSSEGRRCSSYRSVKRLDLTSRCITHVMRNVHNADNIDFCTKILNFDLCFCEDFL